MQRFRNILIGVDLSHADRLGSAELSAPTQEAVKRGLWLAEQLSAEVTFLSVLNISPQADALLAEQFEQATTNVKDEALAVLDELVASAKAQGVASRREVVIGSEWTEIIRQVLRGKHDLVIVGTRQQGAFRRMLFGSTGMKLLRYCPCPVWVTRPDPDWSDVNMLVATDLGEVGQLALTMAINGGQLIDAKLHVLHALEEGLDRHILHHASSDEEREKLISERRAAAEQKLHEQLALTDYRTLVHGVQTHVVEGPADVVVLEAIEQYGIDLLVMGTAGRGGFGGLFLGNTAERLLPDVPCSVLVVKPADFHCPIVLE